MNCLVSCLTAVQRDLASVVRHAGFTGFRNHALRDGSLSWYDQGQYCSHVTLSEKIEIETELGLPYTQWSEREIKYFKLWLERGDDLKEWMDRLALPPYTQWGDFEHTLFRLSF